MRSGAAGIPFLEGFHYPFHPGYHRTQQLLDDGAIGTIGRVEVTMSMPTPPDDDPRWDYALAGGAVMDLGCYAVHVFRQYGKRMGSVPEVVPHARGAPLGKPADRACAFEVAYPDGTVGAARVSMVGERYDFRLAYIGDRGPVTLHDFLDPTATTGDRRVGRDGVGGAWCPPDPPTAISSTRSPVRSGPVSP